jgi:pyruvate,water dikinase
MSFIISSALATDPAIAGNKAANLARLAAAGFAVPPFFVIDPIRFGNRVSEDESARWLGEALGAIADSGKRFAVRSSSQEEDGGIASFAGQFESFLDVPAGEVGAHVGRVIASADAAHVDAYRTARQLAADGRPPAVLVQRMVAASAAGVAFASDVVNGSLDTAVVAAVEGCGDRLVGGEQQGDTWRVDAHGRILGRDLEGDRPVLSDRQVRKVATLVRRVSRARGRPQDIEWAFEGRRLYLLQSRDITTSLESAEPVALWDNSNIVESYGGVTTPLTFSVARGAYSAAYRHLGRAIGVPERTIRENDKAYEQMIGLIRGRVYYNLLNWYRLLMLTPGFRFNQRFMEQMMGVTEGLPTDTLPRPPRPGIANALRAGVDMTRVALRLVGRMAVHGRAVARFHRTVDGLLGKVDLGAMTLEQLVSHYENLQSEVIPAWDTPLVNDLFCMVFHGALRELVQRWFDNEHKDIHNELVAGEDDIVSLEPVRQMRRLAQLAREDAPLCAALCDAPAASLRQHIDANPAFADVFNGYLERFGDRCLDELKLESRTLVDDPLPFLRGVGQLARRGDGAGQPDSSRERAEQVVLAEFAGSPLRRLVFAGVLRLARARVKDRENMRFERTRVYGRVRAVFVEIGRRFAALGMLDGAEDIFYLDADEVIGAVRGTGITAALASNARSRRREFESYNQEADPPRRFMTIGPPQLRQSMQPVKRQSTANAGDLRQGQACSRGLVRGQVRIVRDPREADIRSGDILVAQRTDPGWVMIFPLVKGMIMERGSLLSHSAIVARELQIPAVVGVDDACEWLKDGDWVELDGGAGTIRLLHEDRGRQ